MFYVTEEYLSVDLVNFYGIAGSQMTTDMSVPLVVTTSRSFPHSRLITGFVTRLTRRVPLVEQELLTLPEHLSSHPVFSGVIRVTRSLVLCVMFCRSLFVLLYFFFQALYYLSFFDLQILVTSLWYLQTLLVSTKCNAKDIMSLQIKTITTVFSFFNLIGFVSKLEIMILSHDLECEMGQFHLRV